MGFEREHRLYAHTDDCFAFELDASGRGLEVKRIARSSVRSSVGSSVGSGPRDGRGFVCACAVTALETLREIDFRFRRDSASSSKEDKLSDNLWEMKFASQLHEREERQLEREERQLEREESQLSRKIGDILSSRHLSDRRGDESCCNPSKGDGSIAQFFAFPILLRMKGF